MKLQALTVAFLLAASSAQAFEVTGGSIALGYSGFTDNLLSDVDKTTLGGQIEVGFSRDFSMQADLGFMNYGFSDFDAHNFGLHGIYHLSDTTSLGGFVGRDTIESEDLSIYGVEVGHQAGPLGLEAYLSIADAGVEDGTVYGLRAAYGITDSTEIGLRYDHINIDGLGASRLSVAGEFALSSGFAVTGEIGSADIDDSGSEGFFAIGAKFNFGANRGATFNQRSVLDLLPGL
jgi:hypothetical protein